MSDTNNSRKAIHFNDAMYALDMAREHGQPVNIRAWEGMTGNILDYKGWKVSSSNWKKGWHRLINPVNGQIRTVPDIFIFEVNGLAVYL